MESKSPNIDETLDVITRFTAVNLNPDDDSDTDDPGEGVGVHATLKVNAIGTGDGSVTVTATQGTAPNAVTVSATQNFDVEATEVFTVLSVEMQDKWVENTDGELEDEDDDREGLDLLNAAIAANIKSTTAALDVDFSVTSVPAGLFDLQMTEGENPEVVVSETTGAPTIVWAVVGGTETAPERAVVPDAEMYEEMVVTLTAEPAGSNADAENLAVTIGIADAEDATEFTDEPANWHLTGSSSKESAATSGAQVSVDGHGPGLCRRRPG